jgi:hypothetical protein
MDEQTPSQVPGLLDVLNRYKWWSAALLLTVEVFLVGNRGGRLVSWMFFVLFSSLVWIPWLFHSDSAFRKAGRAFREGLREPRS